MLNIDEIKTHMLVYLYGVMCDYSSDKEVSLHQIVKIIDTNKEFIHSEKTLERLARFKVDVIILSTYAIPNETVRVNDLLSCIHESVNRTDKTDLYKIFSQIIEEKVVPKKTDLNLDRLKAYMQSGYSNKSENDESTLKLKLNNKKDM